MINRRKNTDRRIYTSEEKQWLLNKSKSKCAHCGKRLSMETMTVEHVVPFSKGGTNDLENHVALCEECNTLKADTIMNPEDWYPYLNKKYLKEIMTYFQNYCQTVNHLYTTNMFTSDVLKISVGLPLAKGKSAILYKDSVNIRKAVYSDLNDIYNFFIKYYTCYEPEFIPKVKESLIRLFEENTIMFYKTSQNIIQAVFLFRYDMSPYIIEEDKICVGLPNLECEVHINPDIEVEEWDGRRDKRIKKAHQNFFVYNDILTHLPKRFLEDLNISESLCTFKYTFDLYNTPVISLLDDRDENYATEDPLNEKAGVISLVVLTNDIKAIVHPIFRSFEGSGSCNEEFIVQNQILRKYASNFSKAMLERLSSSKEIRQFNKTVKETVNGMDLNFVYIHSYLPNS